MSDIRFKYSQIGGGKTLHSVIEMCDELEKSERCIITNISVLLDDCPKGYLTFREWCSEFLKKPVNVGRRMCWLTKEQSMEFYRFMPAEGLTPDQIAKFNLTIHENIFERDGVVLARSRVAQLPLRPDPVYGELVDFSARSRLGGCFLEGVHYFIDEAHKLFSARNYHKVSPRLEDYQSELRKLDDDLTMITQNPEKVDKNCRRNATEWMQVQNMAKTRLWLGVRVSNRFRYHWYNQAEMPGKLDKPTVSGWYSFDKRKRFHQLYLTMDGVGISGGMMKETNRVKSRSPIIWLVALLAVCVFAWYLPKVITGVSDRIIGQSIGGALTGLRSGVAKGMQTNLVASTSPPTSAFPSMAVPAPFAGMGGFSSVPPSGNAKAGAVHFVGQKDDLKVRGWTRVNDDMWVYLSDGRIAKASRGEVDKVGENYCRVLGRTLAVIP